MRPTPTQLFELAVRHPIYFHDLLLRKFRMHRREKWLCVQPSLEKIPPPIFYKLVLTYKCNLRCRMCYEWSENGWCQKEGPLHVQENMSWEVIQKVLDQAQAHRASIVLSGGEPLMHPDFPRLISELKMRKRMAIVCTNGTRLDRVLTETESNPYVSYLVSLDGTRKTNDALRGPGVYQKVMDHIARLKSLRRPPYVGIQFTIGSENCHEILQFCREMVDAHVDWILLNPTWYVSEAMAKAYGEQIHAEFHATTNSATNHQAPPENFPIGTLIDQLSQVEATKWPIQISGYLKSPQDYQMFLQNPAEPLYSKICFKQWVRMDVLPSGEVTPCSLYPDLTFGNLNSQSVMEVWNSATSQKFRTFCRTQHLPVCAKCDALYLYEPRRSFL